MRQGYEEAGEDEMQLGTVSDAVLFTNAFNHGGTCDLYSMASTAELDSQPQLSKRTAGTGSHLEQRNCGYRGGALMVRDDACDDGRCCWATSIPDPCWLES